MTINTILSFLANLNPIILIIVGLILVFASRLAKWVGVICIILGAILLLLPYLLTVI